MGLGTNAIFIGRNNLITAMVFDNADSCFGTGPTLTHQVPTIFNGIVLINPALAFSGNGIGVPIASLAQGQNETLSTNVINGTPPYSYVWEFNGQRFGQDTATVVINANSSDAGTAMVNVIVKDAVNASIMSNVIVGIAAPPPPFVPNTGGFVPGGGGSGSGPVVVPPTTTVATTSISPGTAGNNGGAVQNASTTAPTTTVSGTNSSAGAGGQNSGNTTAPPSSNGLSGLEIDGGVLIVIALILTIGYYLYMNNLSANRVKRRKTKR
jgi:hypothetical protein